MNITIKELARVERYRYRELKCPSRHILAYPECYTIFFN